MSSSPELAAHIDDLLAVVPKMPELGELVEQIVGQLQRDATAAASRAGELEALRRPRDVEAAGAAGYASAVRDQLRAEADRWAALSYALRNGPQVVYDDPDAVSYVMPDEGSRA